MRRFGMILGRGVTLSLALALGLLAVASTLAQAQEKEAAKAKPAAKPKPPIYDTKADARAAVEKATAVARRDGTRVLVMFGFNSCPWCHKLHELFAKDRATHTLLSNGYELLMVDIKAPHADDLLDQCKAALSKEELEKGVGFPFLAVLDGSGKVVTAQRTDPLEAGDHHDPEKVRAFLTKWAPQPRDAEKVVTEALAKAATEDKRVFLHFGAPWCGWCHKLEDFLARPEIAAIVARDYLDVKVDVDRMTHGKEVMDRYTHGKQGGIPWFVVLDPTGKALATSDGPDGNIGYPAAEKEIDHFLSMLKSTVRHTDAAQLATIRKALEEEGAKIRAQLHR